jgi:hypothetical protein
MPPFNGGQIHLDYSSAKRALGVDDFDFLIPTTKKEVECPACYGTGYHKGFGGPCRVIGCKGGKR